MREGAARRWVLFLLVVATLWLVSPHAAEAQWQIASKDEKQTLKFGILVQPQYEALETVTADHYSQNIFIRRLRLIFGGKISERWSFFIETDSPNIGKGTGPSGAKNEPSIYIQDMYITYKPNDDFMVDFGMMLLATSYNHNQSAALLLGLDYGPYSFATSSTMQERVGRDYGVQVRGYPFEKKLEYRAGIFQGFRGTDSANPFRYAARVAYWPWEAPTGFFYPGTLQGTKRIMSIGAFYDGQKDYKSYGTDVFGEFPLGKNAITFQADYATYDGGAYIPAIRKQANLFGELGFLIGAIHLTPYLQYAQQNFDDGIYDDESRWQLGVAYWIANHNLNLKFAYTQIAKDNFPDRNQFQLQFQLFQF